MRVMSFRKDDFYFEIMSTLYTREWEELIKEAYKARRSHYNTSRDEMA